MHYLQMLSFYICCGISVIVFFALGYLTIRFHYAKSAYSVDINKHLCAELLWMIVPFIMLALMAIPVVNIMHATHKNMQHRVLMGRVR